MTPEQQCIAIAEACGWVRDAGHCPCGEDACGAWRNTKDDTFDYLPDYLNDLNAMHEAEKVLTDEQYKIYALWLGPLTSQRQRAYISATAAQRAEAFLRTIGKWEDAAQPANKPVSSGKDGLQ